MCRKMTSKCSRTFARPFQKPGGGCSLAQVTVVLSKISVNILAPPPPCRTLGQSWVGVRGGGSFAACVLLALYSTSALKP